MELLRPQCRVPSKLGFAELLGFVPQLLKLCHTLFPPPQAEQYPPTKGRADNWGL